jgi:teichuronic acid biosynthesis glycosyltransferase TuaC
MKNGSGRLQVAFITTCYPTGYRPRECVFMHRSVRALAPQVDARVIHLRAWRPGRPRVEKRAWEGVEVLSVACPQLPLGSYSHLNTLLLAGFGAASLRATLAWADILHSMDIYPAGFVAGHWARRQGKPHTTHVVGSDLALFLTPNLGKVGMQWLGDLKGVVCNSQAIQGQLLGLLPALKNVRVIHRGVDAQTFSPQGPASGPQVGLPAVRFLYLGGFHTWDARRGEFNIKGGHILLEAWRLAAGHLGPSSLVIGGPGADTANLRNWRAALPGPGAVFITDALPPDSVAGWMRASDVVVVPSLQEGLPNLANEAQACGRPVLGTDAGGIPESVVHGETGWIVPRGEAPALAQGLGWFWTNRSRLPGMGKRGRERMAREFSWERFSREMLAFFSAVL